MLGNGELCGDERSIMRRFLPENFLVATPMGLTRKMLKGGTGKGPIMKFASIYFLIRISTDSGSVSADWRLGQMRLSEGRFPTPGWKPCERPDSKYLVKCGSG